VYDPVLQLTPEAHEGSAGLGAVRQFFRPLGMFAFEITKLHDGCPLREMQKKA
jgi:hypothetical protein